VPVVRAPADRPLAGPKPTFGRALPDVASALLRNGSFWRAELPISTTASRPVGNLTGTGRFQRAGVATPWRREP
jgi:hypothetical protein